MVAAKVLVLGKGAESPTCLSEYLQKRGCECHFATLQKDAEELLRKRTFDLVLSELRLQDGTGLQLIPLLVSLGTSLFYSLAVEDGCWWLPAVWHGQKCWGAPAVRSSEFSRVLDGVLQEILSGATASAGTPPPPPRRPRGSVLSLPAPVPKRPPASSTHATSRKPLHRKVGG